MTFRPMLAGKADLATLKLPMFGAPKLDGIRCLAMDGKGLSRTMKPIRNRYVQDWFGKNAAALEGLDGELIVGSPTAPDVYRTTNSSVMREDGEPDFGFYVFDLWNSTSGFGFRYTKILQTMSDMATRRVIIVKHVEIRDMRQLEQYETKMLSLGYEGVMLRGIISPYKHGRSSTKEGHLLKLKRYEDAEAEIVGYEELLHNGNEAQQDAFGRTKRSSHQGNKTGMNTLGALIVKGKTAFEGIEFRIGTGFDQKLRDDIWAEQVSLMGATVKFKYFDIGVKDKPRHPVFLGFRDSTDT